MLPAELRELGADIRKYGLHEPVVLQRRYRRRADGSIANEHDYELVLVDGRNRLDAMERAGFALIRDGKLGPALGHKALGLEPLTGAYAELDDDVDVYAFVVSRNFHRRHLTAKQKRKLIAKLIKATPEKSDRQIAETVKASPTTVGTVRAEMETKGDVSKLDTRRDSKGRKQPAKKPPRAAANATGAEKTSNKNNAAKPSGAANTAPASPTTPARNDVGSASTSEAERLRARNEKLENEKLLLEIENTGLRSEVEKAKAAAKPAPKSKTASRCSICHEKKRAVLRPVFICDNCVDIYEVREAAPLPDDGLDIPECLRRSAS